MLGRRRRFDLAGNLARQLRRRAKSCTRKPAFAPITSMLISSTSSRDTSLNRAETGNDTSISRCIGYCITRSRGVTSRHSTARAISNSTLGAAIASIGVNTAAPGLSAVAKVRFNRPLLARRPMNRLALKE